MFKNRSLSAVIIRNNLVKEIKLALFAENFLGCIYKPEVVIASVAYKSRSLFYGIEIVNRLTALILLGKEESELFLR